MEISAMIKPNRKMNLTAIVKWLHLPFTAYCDYLFVIKLRFQRVDYASC